MIITSQQSSSQVKGAPICICAAVSPAYSRIRVRALPWRQVPAGSTTRETGHGRTETRTLKAAHVSFLDFPCARQAIKITRRRKDTATGRTTRETVYAVTTLTSAHATTPDLARLVREHWSIEAHHHIRDTTFSEDTSASRTGSGPANLATIRAAVTAAIKDAGHLHIPEGRDRTTPPKPSTSTASIRQKRDIHGTRRSPGFRRGSAFRWLRRGRGRGGHGPGRR
jgi:predicted transposase YbfD/YdcC